MGYLFLLLVEHQTVTGWNPELVLLAVVLPTSTNLAVVIPNSSVFGTLYGI